MKVQRKDLMSKTTKRGPQKARNCFASDHFGCRISSLTIDSHLLARLSSDFFGVVDVDVNVVVVDKEEVVVVLWLFTLCETAAYIK